MKNIIPKLTEYDKDNGYISNINITLRKLHATEKDYLKLYSWCQNKFVYEWFEQRILSYDEIVKKYQNKLQKKIQDLYIIKLNQKDIGLVQIYKFENDITLAELDKYRNIYEYDLFIGEKEYLNKGIGPKVVNFINKLIYKKYNADLIILRPFKRNIRAIKCYQKCGFREILEYEG